MTDEAKRTDASRCVQRAVNTTFIAEGTTDEVHLSLMDKAFKAGTLSPDFMLSLLKDLLREATSSDDVQLPGDLLRRMHVQVGRLEALYTAWLAREAAGVDT